MVVFNDPVGLLPAPLGVEVLHKWQLCPGDVLSDFHWAAILVGRRAESPADV